jgi:glycosyltransferase involved in cell wall biosynthesis
MTSEGTPLISVIIPSYNTATSVERAIESIRRAAKGMAVEVVVVDDGSSDNSMVILGESAKEWPAVRVLTHPGHANLGIASTRNRGIEESKGKYLAFLDADDEMMPNRFEVCVPLLDADDCIDAVVEPYELVHVGGSRSEAMKTGPVFMPISMADPVEALRAAMKSGRLPHTSSITVRQSVLREVGGFPEGLKFNLEKPLWLKLFARGRIANGSSEPVARYYLHDSSACARNEHTAAFRFEDVLAYLDVYRWTKRAAIDDALQDLVRAKIRGKYLHYCSYVNSLENRWWRDRFWPFLHVASAVTGFLLDVHFWKASVRMLLGMGSTPGDSGGLGT